MGQQSKMSKVFSWEYFSYVSLDDAVAYKEVLVMPAVIFVLAVVWMQLVKGTTSEESQKEPTSREINFEQAYQDAKLNEVDSGAELDSQAEDEDGEEKEVEDIGSVENVDKDETEKKED